MLSACIARFLISCPLGFALVPLSGFRRCALVSVPSGGSTRCRWSACFRALAWRRRSPSWHGRQRPGVRSWLQATRFVLAQMAGAARCFRRGVSGKAITDEHRKLLYLQLHDCSNALPRCWPKSEHASCGPPSDLCSAAKLCIISVIVFLGIACVLAVLKGELMLPFTSGTYTSSKRRWLQLSNRCVFTCVGWGDAFGNAQVHAIVAVLIRQFTGPTYITPFVLFGIVAVPFRAACAFFLACRGESESVGSCRKAGRAIYRLAAPLLHRVFCPPRRPINPQFLVSRCRSLRRPVGRSEGRCAWQCHRLGTMWQLPC